MAMRGKRIDTVEPTELQISPEKVCFVVIKAREFDVKDAVTEPDPGSNPSDDQMAAVLEDHADDPVVEELSSFIGAMSEDEQIDLVAMAWLGRGDYTADDWPSVPRGSGARPQSEHGSLSPRHAHAGRLPRRRPSVARLLLRAVRNEPAMMGEAPLSAKGS